MVRHRNQSDSETISVEDLDQVDISCLAPFSYVALGLHHRPQSMEEKVSVTVVQCLNTRSVSGNRKTGDRSDSGSTGMWSGGFSCIRLSVTEICVIRGRLEEILKETKTVSARDYVSIVLTDEEELYQPKEQLERIFTIILEVRTERNRSLYRNGKTRAEDTDRSETGFEQFFSQIQGRKLQEEEAAVLEEELRQNQGGRRMRPMILTMSAFGSYADCVTIDFGQVQQGLFRSRRYRAGKYNDL